MTLHVKRWLFLVHRWLGVAMCLLFATWFVSGMVMMYVGYPKLTEPERLRHLPPLAAAMPLLAPGPALAAAGVAGPLDELRLAAARAGRPVYLAQLGDATIVVDAHTGARLGAPDARQALDGAAAFAGPGVGVRYLDTVMEDAFTHTRSLDRHRPLHRVQAQDAAHTLLYISSRSGEVVRDATRHERLWNYAGAWIHWLYPLRGNAFQPYWMHTINWLAIAGIAAAVSGAAVGVLRWRFRRPYRSGARTPYPRALMRWHHVVGLLFALTTTTFVFSGLMSMNPWHIFDSGAPPLRMDALQGGALTLSARDAAPAALLAGAGDVRELRWVRVLGKTRVLAYGAAGVPRVLDSHDAQPVTLDAAALRSAAGGLLAAPVAHIAQIDRHDVYYFERDAAAMYGGSEKPLPILRIVFADPHATWIQLDPRTGAILDRLDTGKRANRWLFSMLHSWDWLPLLQRRPLWDALLIFLSLGGLLLSVTGVAIGWRRLGIKLRGAGVRRRS